MKYVYLIRHAHAKTFMFQGDHQRPLTERGQQEAALTAACLSAHLDGRSVLLCYSDALRTTETAQIILAHLSSHAVTARAEASLYNAKEAVLVQTIQNTPSMYDTLVLIGHNSGISYCAEYVCGLPLPDMSPCAIYGFEYACSGWDEIAEGTGRLCLTYAPPAV